MNILATFKFPNYNKHVVAFVCEQLEPCYATYQTAFGNFCSFSNSSSAYNGLQVLHLLVVDETFVSITLAKFVFGCTTR